MHRFHRTLGIAVLIAAAASAQIPFYNSNEEYCQANPHAPTCRDGRPIDPQADMQKTVQSVTTNPMQDWCNNNPNQPVCRGNKANSSAPQVVAPVAPTAPAGANYTLVPPTTSRTRKGPADVRLGELDWRLVLPQSDFLLGINVSDLLGSDLARALIHAWAGKLGAAAAEQDKLLGSLADVSQTVISVHQNEILIVLMGRVDDFPEVNQTGPMQSVKVAPDTVIFGSNRTLNSTLFRLKFPLNASAQIKEGQQLSRSYQLWACGKPAAFAAFGRPMPANSPVSSMKFGISLRDQFRMDTILDAASPVAAKRLLETSGKNAPRELTASIEGSSVHYTMQLDRAAALARFSGFLSEPMGRQLAPLLAAARQMSADKASGAARLSPGKAVIEGLDDGPKEVPLAKP